MNRVERRVIEAAEKFCNENDCWTWSGADRELLSAVQKMRSYRAEKRAKALDEAKRQG